MSLENFIVRIMVRDMGTVVTTVITESTPLNMDIVESLLRVRLP